MRQSIPLFITGFLQVLFVTMSTYFIANNMIFGATLSGFMISIIWTFNVKRIAFSRMIERVVYAVGASLGTAAGYILGKLINETTWQ